LQKEAKSRNHAHRECWNVLRACLKISKGAAAGDFGFAQDGEGGASSQLAVTTEPTLDKDKRPAARRVFAEKAVWLRCSPVEDPQGVFFFVAPRHPAFSPKTAPLGILRQALMFRIRLTSPLQH
jgi:hypothetical protein